MRWLGKHQGRGDEEHDKDMEKRRAQAVASCRSASPHHAYHPLQGGGESNRTGLTLHREMNSRLNYAIYCGGYGFYGRLDLRQLLLNTFPLNTESKINQKLILRNRSAARP